RRRHTRSDRDWSSDVCSSDLPTSFRGGGLFANAANLRAIAGAGFTVDASATPAGVFGQLTLPWTLAKDAQPYRPARDDANAPGRSEERRVGKEGRAWWPAESA